MQRITCAIKDANYTVYWISRHHIDIKNESNDVKRSYIQCLFNSGILFYLEFNIRLFLRLIKSDCDAISSVDLDTLSAAYFASKLKRKHLIFDAHEIFYEVPELIGKPFKKWVWKRVALWCIPRTDLCYTVNNSLRKHYESNYSKSFHVIRNVPDIAMQARTVIKNNKTMVYLGAVNKGRGIEIAIEALKILTDYKLVVIGKGDEYDKMQKLAKSYNVINRVEFKGYTIPDKIFPILRQCSIGLNLLVADSENYRLSLANKFFDYMHAGLPSVNMQYPEYESILSEHKVGVMIKDYNVEALVEAVVQLEDTLLFDKLTDNCVAYRSKYTWGREKVELVEIYGRLNQS